MPVGAMFLGEFLGERFLGSLFDGSPFVGSLLVGAMLVIGAMFVVGPFVVGALSIAETMLPLGSVLLTPSVAGQMLRQPRRCALRRVGVSL